MSTAVEPRPSLARRIGAVLLTFVLYAVLVLWMTWPLAAHLGTRMPHTNLLCRIDPLYMAWILAHESEALLGGPDAFVDTNIFFPARNTLFYGDTGFGALPYFFPVFAATGNPTLALNVVLLGCIVLTATALHRVVVRWTGSELAGFLGGWAYLTARWVLWEFLPTAPSYSVLQYLPIVVLLASVPAARWSSALLLLPFAVVQCLTDVVYVAAATMVPLGILAAWRLARKETRTAGWRLAVVLASAVVVLSPVYAGHLAVRADNPKLMYQTPWFWRLSIEPTVLPWGLLAPQAATGVALAALLLIVVGGVLFFRFREKERSDEPLRAAWLHGFFWAGIGLLMSIAPIVSILGTNLRLPQYWIGEWLPIYELVRVPARLGLAAIVGLALLTGIAFAECSRRLSRAVGSRFAPIGLAIVVAGSMYAQYAWGFGATAAMGWKPLPDEYPTREPIAARQPFLPILREPGGPLLEVPASLANLMATEQHARAMYRSVFHGRRLVNGYNSYWPNGFRQRMALARRLPDADALAALRKETGLSLILVHVDEVGRDEIAECEKAHAAGKQPKSCVDEPWLAKRKAWLALAEGSGSEVLHLVARDGNELLFALDAPSS